MANETGFNLVNTSNSRSNYPLHAAAKKGFTELVKVSGDVMYVIVLCIRRGACSFY